uniref:Uncharacterized protein n=1 Tax=Spongospora subterranea TaxID=70186 RepID=A0A0H5QZ05_9EUKA|eukprot:CRZ06947.1 hypothetical protein [Spongospora subterranea]
MESIWLKTIHQMQQRSLGADGGAGNLIESINWAHFLIEKKIHEVVVGRFDHIETVKIRWQHMLNRQFFSQSMVSWRITLEVDHQRRSTQMQRRVLIHFVFYELLMVPLTMARNPSRLPTSKPSKAPSKVAKCT